MFPLSVPASPTDESTPKPLALHPVGQKGLLRALAQICAASQVRIMQAQVCMDSGHRSNAVSGALWKNPWSV